MPASSFRCSSRCLLRFSFAVTLLCKLTDELTLGPGQPIIVCTDHDDSLFVPAVTFDLFGWSARSTVAGWKPSHRLLSRFDSRVCASSAEANSAPSAAYAAASTQLSL